MKTRNFPAKKLARQIVAAKGNPSHFVAELSDARNLRTKKRNSHKAV